MYRVCAGSSRKFTGVRGAKARANPPSSAVDDKHVSIKSQINGKEK